MGGCTICPVHATHTYSLKSSTYLKRSTSWTWAHPVLPATMGQEEGEEKTEHTVEWARENLSRAQIDEFKQAFDIFDEDGGGDISTRELGRVMKLLGQNPSPQQLQQIVLEVDQDGSGTIDFDEFLIMMVMQLEGDKKDDDVEELKEIFRYYDHDDDTFIDFQEFAQALKDCGADPQCEDWEAQYLFGEVDRNGDARIDIEEWCNWHGIDVHDT